MALRALFVLVVLGGAGALLLSSASGGGSRPHDSACGVVDLEPGVGGLEGARRATLCLINAERAGRGLAPLQRRTQLELASERHSRDMVTRHFFEHDTPDGIDPQARMLAAGYPADNAITGENIAWATGPRATPYEIVDLWMHSPPHRENILRPEFTEIGLGLVRGAPGNPRSNGTPWTYTTDFGGPPVRQ